MNERIKELAEQAGMFIVDDKFSSGGRFAEKFAELIVQDTISKIESVGWKSSNDIPFEITDLFVKQIKEHFGVKE